MTKLAMHYCPNSQNPIYFYAREDAVMQLDCADCQVDGCKGPKFRIMTVPSMSALRAAQRRTAALDHV